MLGSLLLMFVMGYGISMDVENLRFAVLDRDQTAMSQNYTLSLSGSRYFSERPPIADYAEHMRMIGLVFNRLGVHWEVEGNDIIVPEYQPLKVVSDIGLNNTVALFFPPGVRSEKNRPVEICRQTKNDRERVNSGNRAARSVLPLRSAWP